MDDGDLIRELRALADRIEQRAPASSASFAADPLGGLERASIAEEVASLLRHDLRNHLASIRNAAFYLRRRAKDTEIWRSDPRMSQFFLLIDDTVLEATGLLEDRLILKHLFSRNVARVSGASCLDEGASSARVPAAIKLEIEACPGDVVADRAEVALAMRCLIENAAEAATSCVKVSARAGAGRYEIAVSDDGAGVPEALAEQIFDAFYTTKEGRAGLGLGIARRVARRYGGELGLWRGGAADRGARMVFALPLVDASDLRSPAGLRLLLVDDDQSNLLTLSVLLEEEGFVVDVAASFAAARDKIAAEGAAYDVVLLDQSLGDGHGTALLPLVRARLPEARALLLTGSLDGEELASAGFDAILIKSTPFPEVLAAVLAAVQRAEPAP